MWRCVVAFGYPQLGASRAPLSQEEPNEAVQMFIFGRSEARSMAKRPPVPDRGRRWLIRLEPALDLGQVETVDLGRPHILGQEIDHSSPLDTVDDALGLVEGAILSVGPEAVQGLLNADRQAVAGERCDGQSARLHSNAKVVAGQTHVGRHQIEGDEGFAASQVVARAVGLG